MALTACIIYDRCRYKATFHNNKSKVAEAAAEAAAAAAAVSGQTTAYT